jgi:LacI family transcriptional regulator
MDVARQAEVSRSTASRALGGNGYVAEPVRRRIIAAADELGYLPDIAARSFRTGNASTVGLLVSDLRSPLQSDIAAGVSERLAANNYTLLVAHTTRDRERQLEAARAFVARRVAGIVLTPLGDDTPRFLRQQGIPFVEVDGEPTTVPCDRVLPHGIAAGRRLWQLLHDLGHQNITVVVDDSPTATQINFAKGCNGYTEDGRPPADESTAQEQGEEAPDAQVALVRTSELGPHPFTTGPLRDTSGVLAASAEIAERLWAGLAERPRTDPEVSFASFGDASWMRLVSPSVTATDLDGAGIGSRAAETLMARLARPDQELVQELVPVDIVLRDSTRAVAR